jgi:hypothetical protein
MLSKRSIDLLLDLAENKLSDIVPFDREDMREIKILQTCVNELRALRGMPPLEATPQPGAQRAPDRALQRTA